MAKERKRKKYEDSGNPEDSETTVDPYTGELKPVAEDADQFIEVVPEETDDREGKNYILNEETSMDSYAADSDADAVAEQSAHYTEDKDIEADFAERQELAWRGVGSCWKNWMNIILSPLRFLAAIWMRRGRQAMWQAKRL